VQSRTFQILEKKKMMRRKRWRQAYLDAGEEDEGGGDAAAREGFRRRLLILWPRFADGDARLSRLLEACVSLSPSSPCLSVTYSSFRFEFRLHFRPTHTPIFTGQIHEKEKKKRGEIHRMAEQSRCYVGVLFLRYQCYK